MIKANFCRIKKGGKRNRVWVNDSAQVRCAFLRVCARAWDARKRVCTPGKYDEVHLRKFLSFITRILRVDLAVHWQSKMFIQSQNGLCYSSQDGSTSGPHILGRFRQRVQSEIMFELVVCSEQIGGLAMTPKQQKLDPTNLLLLFRPEKKILKTYRLRDHDQDRDPNNS